MPRRQVRAIQNDTGIATVTVTRQAMRLSMAFSLY
jgi:hypothetical protein